MGEIREIKLFFFTIILINYTEFFQICATEIELQSPRVSRYDERTVRWGNWDRCPDGQFVVAMTLKTLPAKRWGEGYLDDSGLNGVRFYCDSIVDGDSSMGRSISSAVGKYGTWGSNIRCPDSGVVVGYQLMSFAGGSIDLVGATNLRMVCTGTNDNPRMEGVGEPWGEWTEEQKCPQKTAICAIRTQIDDNKVPGGLDDAKGVVNVDVKCCDVPAPATPKCGKPEVSVVATKNNLLGQTNVSFTEKWQTGFKFDSEHHSFQSEITYESLDFQFSIASLELPFTLGLAVNQNSASQAYKKRTDLKYETIGQSYDVPPGVKTVLQQEIVRCGALIARSDVVRIDYCSETELCTNGDTRKESTNETAQTDQGKSGNIFLAIGLPLLVLFLGVGGVWYWKKRSKRVQIPSNENIDSCRQPNTEPEPLQSTVLDENNLASITYTVPIKNASKGRSEQSPPKPISDPSTLL